MADEAYEEAVTRIREVITDAIRTTLAPAYPPEQRNGIEYIGLVCGLTCAIGDLFIDGGVPVGDAIGIVAELNDTLASDPRLLSFFTKGNS